MNIINRRATNGQIQKLKAEGLACAIVLANLKTAMVNYYGMKLIGDNIRPYLRGWYDNNCMPDGIKSYLIETWVKPKCDEILLSSGFSSHTSTEMIFNNLSEREANCIIEEFIGIRKELQREPEVIHRTISRVFNMSHEGRYANKNTTI